MKSKQKILEIKNLSFNYSKNLKIFNDINLDIKKGEMVAIIGSSGVGKSTLFKLLVKSILPQSGIISLFGSNINEIKPKEWKKIIDKIGFLTQKPNLIISDSVFMNVKRSITQYKNNFYKLFSLITNEQKINIFKQLDDLNILSKAFYRVSDLSGGQQQRVEIVKLLVKNSELILADEPTSNLDRQTSQDVLDILKQLKKEKQLTILVNIHDLSFLKTHFDRVIGIKDNSIQLNKLTKDIKEWEIEKIIQKNK
ncbi:phosphonate ABC transporter ATP-binding protein [Mycoplasma phocoenae]|uniref:ATP-binding cassette domain-containing protein n=1 Tax=Mycoplasma phocoenae TaxID=754517 RepID=A0A858U4R7_9MOLU|nr:ATP-binding cassette domain-containing protein [Mycoplasma phocoenae]QJG67041.1 ATP-binding cassette domain-containing protein [Mycoplasma phocoenae]